MSDLESSEDVSRLIPLEAARASLLHWWREPIAGLISVAIGTFDSWYFGRDLGLSSNIDELLIMGGIILIAGSRKLFSGAPPPTVTPTTGPLKQNGA
jgi:hypothetical protein